MDTKEFEIPVPWGHVAAKACGDEKDEAVLAFHGVMDNAGSFDNLINLLPPSFYYICIDLPGHGRSSHFPPTLPIHSIDNIIVYKVVAEFFGRENYILMGHSYGGQIGIMFAQLYPQYISKLILLDTYYLYPSLPGFFMSRLLDSHELLFKTLNQKAESRPVYTYDEALNKLENNRHYGKLTRKAAEPLLVRMLQQVGEDGYVFVNDQRLKCFQNPSANFQYLLETFKARPVKCRVLIIIAKESRAQTIFFKPLHNLYRKLKFKIKVVDGHHDVHNTNPERIAPIITQFLLTKKSKL